MREEGREADVFAPALNTTIYSYRTGTEKTFPLSRCCTLHSIGVAAVTTTQGF